MPDGEWEKFIVDEFAICAVTSLSAHSLVHYVYGPTKIPGLAEHLDLTLPWRETDTHIEMLPSDVNDDGEELDVDAGKITIDDSNCNTFVLFGQKNTQTGKVRLDYDIVQLMLIRSTHYLSISLMSSTQFCLTTYLVES